MRECEELVEVRILVAFEYEYRAYQEAIASAIQECRPSDEVTAAEQPLESEISQFDPRVVICGLIEQKGLQDGRLAWVDLSEVPENPARIYLDGRLSEKPNPSLEELLKVLDETEELVRSGGRHTRQG